MLNINDQQWETIFLSHPNCRSPYSSKCFFHKFCALQIAAKRLWRCNAKTSYIQDGLNNNQITLPRLIDWPLVSKQNKTLFCVAFISYVRIMWHRKNEGKFSLWPNNYCFLYDDPESTTKSFDSWKLKLQRS